jgi:hypothetical protein
MAGRQSLACALLNEKRHQPLDQVVRNGLSEWDCTVPLPDL